MENCDCGPEGCICQSCGMPIKEEKDQGTKEGGEKSCEYCTYCFKDGEFSIKTDSVEEYMEKVKEKMLEMGMSEEEVEKIAKMMVPALPMLKRWKV